MENGQQYRGGPSNRGRGGGGGRCAKRPPPCPAKYKENRSVQSGLWGRETHNMDRALATMVLEMKKWIPAREIKECYARCSYCGGTGLIQPARAEAVGRLIMSNVTFDAFPDPYAPLHLLLYEFKRNFDRFLTTRRCLTNYGGRDLHPVMHFMLKSFQEPLYIFAARVCLYPLWIYKKVESFVKKYEKSYHSGRAECIDFFGLAGRFEQCYLSGRPLVAAGILDSLSNASHKNRISVNFPIRDKTYLDNWFQQYVPLEQFPMITLCNGYLGHRFNAEEVALALEKKGKPPLPLSKMVDNGADRNSIIHAIAIKAYQHLIVEQGAGTVEVVTGPPEPLIAAGIVLEVKGQPLAPSEERALSNSGSSREENLPSGSRKRESRDEERPKKRPTPVEKVSSSDSNDDEVVEIKSEQKKVIPPPPKKAKVTNDTSSSDSEDDAKPVANVKPTPAAKPKVLQKNVVTSSDSSSGDEAVAHKTKAKASNKQSNIISPEKCASTERVVSVPAVLLVKRECPEEPERFPTPDLPQFTSRSSSGISVNQNDAPQSPNLGWVGAMAASTAIAPIHLSPALPPNTSLPGAIVTQNEALRLASESVIMYYDYEKQSPRFGSTLVSLAMASPIPQLLIIRVHPAVGPEIFQSLGLPVPILLTDLPRFHVKPGLESRASKLGFFSLNKVTMTQNALLATGRLSDVMTFGEFVAFLGSFNSSVLAVADQPDRRSFWKRTGEIRHEKIVVA